jgi:sulfopyruvate decarboxylase subunit alpha
MTSLQKNMNIDRHIVEIMQRTGVDLVCSVPCNLLGGILTLLGESRVQYVPVTREEEGVGIAAGAALAGKKPLLLMQNSGLGNCVNALASLTGLYELPLFLLMSHRGGERELIAAQKPMGQAAPRVLDALGIPFDVIAAPADLGRLESALLGAFARSRVRAAFLQPELWPCSA